MTVTIIIPTALRQHTDNEDELKLNARTVNDALKELVTAFPNLRKYLYSESGRLRNFINIYLNGEDIRYKEGENTALKDGDTLMIVPAVAGGAHASFDEDEGEEERQPSVSFSSGEFARYSRHLIMPEVGLEGQRKLKSASVLVIGAGGLGTPSATYLAAAGVGRIGIVDFDTIEKSNLHRQVLYSEQDVGKSKADVARERLLQINPNISIEVHKVRLDSTNAMEILGGYDVIMDGTDNFPTRYLVNDACVLLGKPNVYASIFRFEGQASVFAMPRHALLPVPLSGAPSSWARPLLCRGRRARGAPRDNGEHPGGGGDRPHPGQGASPSRQAPPVRRPGHDVQGAEAEEEPLLCRLRP